jgi:hypothetical protein
MHKKNINVSNVFHDQGGVQGNVEEQLTGGCFMVPAVSLGFASLVITIIHSFF